MATRRSTAQKKSSRDSGLPLPSFRLPSPLRREVFGVLSIVIGLLSGIALLSPSGTVSGLWHELLVVLFGWMAPLPALASIVLGVQLIRDGITQERYVRWETLTALAVLVLAATAFGQAIAGPPEMAAAYPVGGAIGLQILAPLTTALGFAGAVIVLFALLLITTIITFSISLGRMRSALGGMWYVVRLVGKGIGVLFRAAGGAYRRMGERATEPEEEEPPQPRALNVRVASNVNAANGSAAPALPAMEVVVPNPADADDPTEAKDTAVDPDSETAMETEADAT
ncbi:MAG: hypothetical protein F4X83_11080, partial [Chloroflexi bacterium]|nr:hypothetical protein [Chloroflexota bacterium]